MATTLTLKIWYCETCGYTAPALIDPFSDSFVQKYNGVQKGGCPSCATNPNAQSRKHSSLEFLEGMDLSVKSTTETLEDHEIEAELKPDFDDDGNSVMVKTGEREVLGIVDGKPAVIVEDVMEQKTRELTNKELTDLKAQRNRNLDALEAIAVQ